MEEAKAEKTMNGECSHENLKAHVISLTECMGI